MPTPAVIDSLLGFLCGFPSVRQYHNKIVAQKVGVEIFSQLCSQYFKVFSVHLSIASNSHAELCNIIDSESRASFSTNQY